MSQMHWISNRPNWTLSQSLLQMLCKAPSTLLYHDPSPSPPPFTPGGSTNTPTRLLTHFFTTRPDWLSHRDCSVWICLLPMTTRSTSTPLSWPWSARHWTSRSPRAQKVWSPSYLLLLQFPHDFFSFYLIFPQSAASNPETFLKLHLLYLKYSVILMAAYTVYIYISYVKWWGWNGGFFIKNRMTSD